MSPWPGFNNRLQTETLGATGQTGPQAGEARGTVRAVFRIVWQAGEKFAADDGWAIASYIGLTLLKIGRAHV